MKKEILAAMLALATARAFASAPVSPTRLPSPDVEKLANGLTVAWFVDAKIPVVDFALLSDAGNKNDPKGKSGVAEMTSRLLERGSAGRSAEQIADAIEKLGASGYATADEDTISVGIHGLSQDASTLMALLADVILRPNFSEKEFRSEREKYRESWNHLGDSLDGLAAHAAGRILRYGTIYQRGEIARPADAAKLSLADVKAYYRANVTPSNSVLAIVGRVDRAALRAQLDSLFGNWRPPGKPSTPFASKDPRFKPNEGEIVIVDRKGFPQAQLRMGIPVPGYRWDRRYDFLVLNTILGESFNSRLNSVLRDQLGLTYGISSDVAYLKEAAFFQVSSSTQSPQIGALLAETLRILRQTRVDGVSEGEIQIAKDYLVGNFPLGMATLGSVAVRWLSGYLFQLGPDYLNEFIPKVRGVTPEGVKTATEDALLVDKSAIVVSGDADVIRKSLKEAGFTKVRILSAKSLTR